MRYIINSIQGIDTGLEIVRLDKEIDEVILQNLGSDIQRLITVLNEIVKNKHIKKISFEFAANMSEHFDQITGFIKKHRRNFTITFKSEDDKLFLFALLSDIGFEIIENQDSYSINLFNLQPNLIPSAATPKSQIGVDELKVLPAEKKDSADNIKKTSPVTRKHPRYDNAIESSSDSNDHETHSAVVNLPTLATLKRNFVVHHCENVAEVKLGADTFGQPARQNFNAIATFDNEDDSDDENRKKKRLLHVNCGEAAQLHIAVGKGRKKEISKLLDRKSEDEKMKLLHSFCCDEDTKGASLWRLALLGEQSILFQVLLEIGVHPLLTSSENCTILHDIIKFKNVIALLHLITYFPAEIFIKLCNRPFLQEGHYTGLYVLDLLSCQTLRQFENYEVTLDQKNRTEFDNIVTIVSELVDHGAESQLIPEAGVISAMLDRGDDGRYTRQTVWELMEKISLTFLEKLTSNNAQEISRTRFESGIEQSLRPLAQTWNRGGVLNNSPANNPSAEAEKFAIESELAIAAGISEEELRQQEALLKQYQR